MGAIQTILVYGFLGLLVAMAIVTFVPKHCTVSRIEGFQDKPGISMCPENTKSYYDKEGNLNCCKGQVNGNRCEGEPVCTFSGDLSKLPFCGKQRAKRYNGEIWPIVKQVITTPNSFLQAVIGTMERLIANLRQAQADTKISKATVDKLQALNQESFQWLNTPPYNQPAIELQEETMRVLTGVMEILQKEPIMKDTAYIQQQVQKEICKK